MKKQNNVKCYAQEDDTVIKAFLKQIKETPLTDAEIERAMSDEFAYLDED